MNRLLYLMITIAAISANAQSNFNYSRDFKSLQSQSNNKNSALNYQTLLGRFKQNDPKLTEHETLALLIGYTAQPKYLPGSDLFKEGIIYSLNDDSKFEEAIGLSTKYLKANPLSLKANFAKSQAFKKLKENDSATFYDKKWQKILKTMFYSGNGMNIKTPIFSPGAEDAKEFIEFYVGAKPLGHKEEKDADGHVVQVWEALLGQKKLVLYFITDHSAIKMKEEQTR